MDRHPTERSKTRSVEQGGPNAAGIYYRAGLQSANDPLEYVMSSEIVDRYGDIVTVGGWELDNFRANPTALWAHRSSELPIGTWSDVRVKGKQLLGRLQLALPGTSEFHDTVRSLVEQRVLRAVSVGFRSTKTPELVDDDADEWWGPFRFVGQELLECSLVNVPANPEALQRLLKAMNPSEREIAHLPAAAKSRGMESVQRARFELDTFRRVRLTRNQHTSGELS